MGVPPCLSIDKQPQKSWPSKLLRVPTLLLVQTQLEMYLHPIWIWPILPRQLWSVAHHMIPSRALKSRAQMIKWSTHGDSPFRLGIPIFIQSKARIRTPIGRAFPRVDNTVGLANDLFPSVHRSYLFRHLKANITWTTSDLRLPHLDTYVSNLAHYFLTTVYTLFGSSFSSN